MISKNNENVKITDLENLSAVKQKLYEITSYNEFSKKTSKENSSRGSVYNTKNGEKEQYKEQDYVDPDDIVICQKDTDEYYNDNKRSQYYIEGKQKEICEQTILKLNEHDLGIIDIIIE